MKDRLLAIVVMAGALGYLYADTQLPRAVVGDPLGPKVFPALIGAGLFLSGLFLLISASRDSTPWSFTGLGVPGHYVVLIGIAIWTAVYYAAFDPVGYVLSTAVYMLVLLAYFNRGRHLTNVLIAAGFTIVAYLVFHRFLGVNMPRGLLG